MMNKILYILIILIFVSCEKTNRNDEITKLLDESELLKLNNNTFAISDSANSVLVININDTTSYPTFGYTDLMVSHLIREIHLHLGNYDSIAFYHSMVNWNLRFRICYSVSDIKEVMKEPQLEILTDVTNYMLFKFSREEFIQIEFSIERNNNYFKNYNFHSYLPNLIFSCVQNCDINSIEYKAMLVQGILALGLGDDKKLGLFNLVKQHCQGTRFSKTDVPPFEPNLEFIEQASRPNHSFD